MIRTVILFAAAMTATPLLAQPTKTEWINVYASALTVAKTAEEHCPGVEANMIEIFNIRLKAGFQDSDDATIARALVAKTTTFEEAIRSAGASQWCASTISLFGPNGTLMKNMIIKAAK